MEPKRYFCLSALFRIGLSNIGIGSSVERSLGGSGDDPIDYSQERTPVSTDSKDSPTPKPTSTPDFISSHPLQGFSHTPVLRQERRTLQSRPIPSSPEPERGRKRRRDQLHGIPSQQDYIESVNRQRIIGRRIGEISPPGKETEFSTSGPKKSSTPSIPHNRVSDQDLEYPRLPTDPVSPDFICHRTWPFGFSKSNIRPDRGLPGENNRCVRLYLDEFTDDATPGLQTPYSRPKGKLPLNRVKSRKIKTRFRSPERRSSGSESSDDAPSPKQKHFLPRTGSNSLKMIPPQDTSLSRFATTAGPANTGKVPTTERPFSAYHAVAQHRAQEKALPTPEPTLRPSIGPEFISPVYPQLPTTPSPKSTRQSPTPRPSEISGGSGVVSDSLHRILLRVEDRIIRNANRHHEQNESRHTTTHDLMAQNDQTAVDRYRRIRREFDDDERENERRHGEIRNRFDQNDGRGMEITQHLQENRTTNNGRDRELRDSLTDNQAENGRHHDELINELNTTRDEVLRHHNDLTNQLVGNLAEHGRRHVQTIQHVNRQHTELLDQINQNQTTHTTNYNDTIQHINRRHTELSDQIDQNHTEHARHYDQTMQHIDRWHTATSNKTTLNQAADENRHTVTREHFDRHLTEQLSCLTTQIQQELGVVATQTVTPNRQDLDTAV
ncbi:hypothetical protein EJ08DRAFT_666775 [Tothia fuscella]|uniref:Uncharacterized protein n=1 Tax=Tothia fuscella TaxID=1048955 RepID=A0A9P4NDY8_9PEZI|nr:hypothetical protein EJ08DRAFT_666775 [Tothia fuscella]